MSDTIDRASDSIKEGQEARDVAILVSVLAAALALFEMQERAAQNDYVSRHIQVSDDYAFYQAKTVRADVFRLHAETLAASARAADPVVQKEIAAANMQAARLDDDEATRGRKQLRADAEQHKAERERLLHRYERYEVVVGALQIAIVLASAAIVTRVRKVGYAAGVIGAAAIVGGVLVAADIL